ncbi:MAG: hypothetical protein H7X77_00065 [Anaerolineae bacterium]|nr:hypothetical protein [Anaerolineae bacterium]
MLVRRRRLLIGTGVVGLVVLVIGGIYLWQNLVFNGEVRPIPGTPYHLVIQSGVPETDLALVTEGLMLADRYFTAQLGVKVAKPVEVRMARTTPCIPFTSMISSSTAIADEAEICVNTMSYAWTKIIPQNRRVGLSIIAHENFHNLQGQLGCLPGPNDHEYAWWVEGSATYVGWHTLIEAGMITEAEVVEVMREWGGFDNNLQPLSSYDERIPGDPEYALAYRAIADLIERAGTPASLNQFCDQVGQGKNWRVAFEDVYKIAVDDFYSTFEQQRGA